MPERDIKICVRISLSEAQKEAFDEAIADTRNSRITDFVKGAVLFYLAENGYLEGEE